MSRPLRRTRGDLIATAVLAAVSVAAVAGVWATAPIRSSELTPAAEEFQATAPLDEVPAALQETWTAPAALSAVPRPVSIDGLVIAHDAHTVAALDPASGETVWSYTRDDRELCSLGAAWGRVVTTWRASQGCGDVVSIDASTGQYHRTRSAIAPDQVVPVASNDRIGTQGASRLELWRSDLVRTVEYGEVEGVQEPHLQPHPECELTSALTRSDLLAVTEVCADGTWLRLQETTPEDSREPELHASVPLGSPDDRLVAIGESAAAVLIDAEVVSFSAEGTELHRSSVPASRTADAPRSATADLPHHMTWYDGAHLVLLSPTELEVQHVIEGALGTGVAVGDRLLLPVAEGIAVIDWVTGEQERILPVDRGDWNGDVTLGMAGGVVVEKRGDTLHGLQA
ncbi:MAG: hypothetical protein Q4G50_05620 [Corynebacterium sp.]|uniref:Rv3212 family protein n=1 Tax=Corynebacterium sp. TaxID=1720 RepID=UPI0026E0ED0A|nr:hypothetical protein [Corynebacterium sp.]MDO5669463.1 hypothetical protein [Corynebacterium sp.]